MAALSCVGSKGLFSRGRTAAVLSAVLLSACSVAIAPSQPVVANGRATREAWRFDISSTNDSTVTVAVRDAKWLKSGMHALAVDPAKHDTLVATLTIVRADSTGFQALITGQLRPVDTSHVVVVEPKRPSLLMRRDFWKGAAGGALAATLVFLTSR